MAHTIHPSSAHLPNNKDFEHKFSDYTSWLLIAGTICTILGLIAVIAAPLTTLISVILVGIAFVLSGIVSIVHAARFWWQKWFGFFLHLFSGALYAFLGVMFLVKPLLGAISLTLVLIAFFLVIGVFRIAIALRQRRVYSGWNWTLVNGILNIILALVVLWYWPAPSLWLIGLIVGFDILFVGIALLMLGFTGRSIQEAESRL